MDRVTGSVTRSAFPNFAAHENGQPTPALLWVLVKRPRMIPRCSPGSKGRYHHGFLHHSSCHRPCLGSCIPERSCHRSIPPKPKDHPLSCTHTLGTHRPAQNPPLPLLGEPQPLRLLFPHLHSGAAGVGLASLLQGSRQESPCPRAFSASVSVCLIKAFPRGTSLLETASIRRAKERERWSQCRVPLGTTPAKCRGLAISPLCFHYSRKTISLAGSLH